jgi:hypothetical protein
MFKKKLIKNFGSLFDLIEYEKNSYCLYDKSKKGQHTVHPYIGTFSLSGDNKKYVFNTKEYKDIPSLLKAMEEYNSTLPFNPEIYNPMYTKNCFVEQALREYLTNAGFVYGGGSAANGAYILKDVYGQTICTLYLKIEMDTTEGVIMRTCSENRWVESVFSSLEEGISACNSIIASYCVAINSIVVSVLDKLTVARANKMEEVSFNLRNFQVYKEDAKKKAIEYLEEELNRLKSS